MIKKSHKICIFTASWQENLGDELITLCEIREFREKNNDIDITLFSHNPGNTRRFLLSQKCDMTRLDIAQYFPHFLWKHPLKNIQIFIQMLHTIRSSDEVVIGWGWLFYSAREEWRSPLKLWALRVMIAKFFRTPIRYLALGVTATVNELKPFAKILFQNTTISVRDAWSQKIIKELGYDAERRDDPVFGWQPAPKNTTKKNQKIIGISLRSGYISDDIIEKTIRELIKQWYEIVLLPHSLHPTDERSHDGYYLQRFLFPGVRITQTIEQTLRAYTDLDILFGMRLHSMILAAVYHIPLIALSYSAKTRSLFEGKSIHFLETKTVTTVDIISGVEKVAKTIN